MLVQALADRRRADLRERLLDREGRPAAVAATYELAGETVRLVMPLTMMNASGQALGAPEVRPQDLRELLIVCNDVNLPVGALRLRPQGSAGGHHGLESCLQAVASDQVPRLRIGVGTEPLPRDLEEFVLSPFARTDRPIIKRIIDQAADACETWIQEGIEMAMNRYNRPQDLPT